MNVVFYIEDFELIIVFDLLVMFEQIVWYMGGCFNVVVMELLIFKGFDDLIDSELDFVNILIICLEFLCWLCGEYKWVFVVEDEVLVLWLCVVWLFGQQCQVNEYWQMIDFFVKVLMRVMGL